MREMLLQNVRNGRQTDYNHYRLMAYGRQHGVDTVSCHRLAEASVESIQLLASKVSGLDSAERMTSITWSTVSEEEQWLSTLQTTAIVVKIAA